MTVAPATTWPVVSRTTPEMPGVVIDCAASRTVSSQVIAGSARNRGDDDAPGAAARGDALLDLAALDVDDGDVTRSAVCRVELPAIGAQRDAPGARADILDRTQELPRGDVHDGDRPGAPERVKELLAVGGD